jgi:hypothetical protein
MTTLARVAITNSFANTPPCFTASNSRLCLPFLSLTLNPSPLYSSPAVSSCAPEPDQHSSLEETFMTLISPEVIVALCLGLPSLSFAILTWWEARRWRYRAEIMILPISMLSSSINTAAIGADMKSPSFEALLLWQTGLQARLSTSTVPTLNPKTNAEGERVNAMTAVHLQKNGHGRKPPAEQSNAQ